MRPTIAVCMGTKNLFTRIGFLCRPSNHHTYAPKVVFPDAYFFHLGLVCCHVLGLFFHAGGDNKCSCCRSVCRICTRQLCSCFISGCNRRLSGGHPKGFDSLWCCWCIWLRARLDYVVRSNHCNHRSRFYFSVPYTKI